MAFKLIVYPGAPDVSSLKGKKSEADDSNIFELVCEDDQLEAFEAIKGPGISFSAIAEEPKKKASKKKAKK